MIPCPSCGSTEVRVSKRSHWSDVFHLAGGREAFRCRNCRRRFFVKQAEEKSISTSSRQGSNQRSRPRMSTTAKRRLQRRLLIIFIFIFALALAIFGLFLRFITREPSSSGDPAPSSAVLGVTGIRLC